MQKKTHKKSHLLHALFAASLLAFAGIGGFMLYNWHDVRTSSAEGQAFFTSMADSFAPQGGIQSLVGMYTPMEARIVADELGEAPEEVFTPVVDFAALRAEFPSAVGWILSEGTPINMPIVQGTDNEYYLYRLPDGTRHFYGSIFLDYRNSADFSDNNIKIYGHNTNTGNMFGSLMHYANQAYFEAHDRMYIFTPYAHYVLMLFAAYTLDSRFEVPPLRFADEGHFNEFIGDIRARSIFNSPIIPAFGDQIVFLCTCTNSGLRSERLILVGHLVQL